MMQVGDTIEMAVDMPSEGLRRGDQGRVLRVVNVPNGIYEIAFSVYTEYPPIQLMLSADEIRPVSEFGPLLRMRPVGSDSIRLYLRQWEADNLIDVLRYVQTDPTVHTEQRAWCFELANDIEQLVRRTSTETINDKLREAETNARVSIVRRRGPSRFSRHEGDIGNVPF